MRKIKGIETQRYVIDLYQLDSGYQIMWATLDKAVASEVIKDYNMASYLMDLKLQELEGH